MEIIIRPAVESDFPRIIELFSEFAAFEKLQEKMDNTVERMNAEKEFFHAYVAVTPGGAIIGYATWFYCYFTWSGKAMYMDDLYVQPEYRGKGIGKRLIGEVIKQAKISGCHKLRWQVSDWNTPAIRFYESLGAERDLVNRNCDLDL